MFFKMNQRLRNDIVSFLKDYFTSAELDKGIDALENLINIEDEKSNFDVAYGDFLNNGSIMDVNWDIFTGCRLEGFLRKICNIKGTPCDGLMLQGLYTNIGFYDWLDADDIKEARANDYANMGNPANEKNGGAFHLNDADASKYRGCSNYFDHYIVAYQLRNRSKAHDNPTVDDPITRLENIRSLFVVYMDQCIKNAEIINNGYEKELIDSKIDYVDYATGKAEALKEFDINFVQLNWYDEDNSGLEYSFDTCVKFVGEAGLGKTTQMQKMYLYLLNEVKAGTKKMLPVWVKLADLGEEKNLEKFIREDLGEYEQYYNLLFERGVVALFLDGYNELLTSDIQDKARKTLAKDVDEIHKKYPDIFIAMTDRSKKSNPPCLMKNTLVYSFNGLSEEDMECYIDVKCPVDYRDDCKEYIKTYSWIKNTLFIPAKMNNLIELIENDDKPENEDEFYDMYLVYILDREENEKKETRIEDLKYLLYLLTQEMNHYSDEKMRNEIIKLWLPITGEIRETNRLLDLAIKIPILVPGQNDNSFKFANQQYFYKIEAGL